MLTAQERQALLRGLEETLDVVDVYFWRDNLVVINDYDRDAVEQFLYGSKWGAELGMVLDSEMQNQLVS
jgi:hypothetical protein